MMTLLCLEELRVEAFIAIILPPPLTARISFSRVIRHWSLGETRPCAWRSEMDVFIAEISAGDVVEKRGDNGLSSWFWMVKTDDTLGLCMIICKAIVHAAIIMLI